MLLTFVYDCLFKYPVVLHYLGSSHYSSPKGRRGKGSEDSWGNHMVSGVTKGDQSSHTEYKGEGGAMGNWLPMGGGEIFEYYRALRGSDKFFCDANKILQIPPPPPPDDFEWLHRQNHKEPKPSSPRSVKY